MNLCTPLASGYYVLLIDFSLINKNLKVLSGAI